MATETWSHDGGSTMDTDELFRLIASTQGIEGITFLGGEPFEQPQAMLELSEKAQSVGLSVVVFTGFTHKQLLQLFESDENPQIRALSSIDLLIDGSFDKEQFDLSRPWVGSSNQAYHFLSERYSEKDLSNLQNQLEVRIAPNGKTLINGMGDFSKIKKFL